MGLVASLEHWTQVWSPGLALWVKVQQCRSCSVGCKWGWDLIPGLGTPYSGRTKKKKKLIPWKVNFPVFLSPSPVLRGAHVIGLLCVVPQIFHAHKKNQSCIHNSLFYTTNGNRGHTNVTSLLTFLLTHKINIGGLSISLHTDFFFFFFWQHLWHMEFPRPGIKPALQQWPDPLQWQCQILNLLHHKRTSSTYRFYLFFMSVQHSIVWNFHNLSSHLL